MNRFDSAFSSQQRGVGLWLRALLLVMITTAGLLGSSSVQAQTTLTTTFSANPICAAVGASSTVTGNLTPAVANVGYVGAGVLAAAPVLATPAATYVALDDDEVSAQQLVVAGLGEAIFQFHGREIDLKAAGFYIGSNGFVTFRNAPIETQIAPRNLGAPGLGQTYDAIYLCNTDLSPQLAGQVWWEYDDAANILYVTFDDVPFFLPGGAPGVPNGARVSVQLELHCNGSAIPGRIVIQVDQIDYNAAFVNVAQNQYSIGLLNNCQVPAATIGQSQTPVPFGGIAGVAYSWNPALPMLAGTQVEFFQCPTPGVNCNGVGGSLVGSDVTAPYDYTFNPTPSTSDNTYYFYTRATLNNCETITSATAGISVVAQPNFSTISGSANVCQGNSVTFSATRTVAGSTFTWGTAAPGASIVLSGTGNDVATITFPAGGSQGGTPYNITLTETGPSAPFCSVLNTFGNRITIYTTPSGSITVGTPTQCASATTTVSSTLTAPTGNTYNWSIPTNPTGATLTSTIIQNPTITFPIAAVVQPTAATTTTVQVIVANGPGNLCSATFTANLVINPVPSVKTVTGPVGGAACNATATTYSVAAPAPVAGNEYAFDATISSGTFVWAGGYTNNTFVAGVSSRNITWNHTTNGSTGTVTVTERTASGCLRVHTPVTTNLFITPTGSITVGGTTTTCASSTSATTRSLTAPTGTTYAWTIPTNPSTASLSSTTVQNPTITWPANAVIQPNAATTTTVQVIVANGPSNLCSATFTQSFTINPVPPANTVVGTPASACVNANVLYFIAGLIVPGNTYTYTASGLPFTWQGGYVNGASTLATSLTIQWGAAGTGTITVLETTPLGCTRAYVTTTTVNPLPTPSITGPTTVCQNLTSGTGNPTFATIPSPLNYSYTLVAPNPLNSYRWVVTGGNIVTANATTQNTLPNAATAAGGTGVGGTFNTGVTNVTVQWNTAGAQSITCVENTVNGCQATTTTAITVTASPVSTDFTIVGAGIAPFANPCAGSAQTYTVAGVGTHSITVAGGTITSSALPLTGTGPVTGTGGGGFNVTWGTGASGTITHDYVAGGCSSRNVYTITIQPLPTFSIVAPAGPLCGGNNYTWSLSGQQNFGGSPTYLWTEAADPAGIGTLGANGNPTMTVTFTNPGALTAAYGLSLQVTGSGPTSCVSATVTSNVTIIQTPAAPTVTPGTVACAGSTKTYAVTGGIATATLNWNVGGVLPAGTSPTSGTATYNGAGNASFNVNWGNITPLANAAPVFLPVTFNTSTTYLGCVSANSTYNTSVYAPPASAPVVTTSGPAITSLCANTIVPINLTVTTNSNAGQPTINYTWAASGVTLSVAGPATTNTITNLGGAGAKTITVTATDPASTCATVTVTSFTVAPVPTPAILGQTNVCQDVVDPLGRPHSGPFTHTSDYRTNRVAGNSYSWQVSGGYIVAYSTDDGVSYTNIAGNIAAPASQTLGLTLNASRVRVVWFGSTPGKIKVTETFPGGPGCGATTLDYNVNFNPIPAVQTLTTASNICAGSNLTVTLGASQVNWSYQVQRSTNGGTTWSNSAAAAQNGTGAALSFTVPASELTLTTTAPTPTQYVHRVIATSNGASLVTGCGPYVVSPQNTVSVHGVPPTPTLAVVPGSERTCYGDLIFFTATGTVTWADYELERSPAGLGAWASVGVYPGAAGSTSVIDATVPAGGGPLLAVNNYDYRVRAISTTNPPACQSGNSGTVSTRVFDLPTDPGVTVTPNNVCFEEDVVISLASTQAGVRYEVRRAGLPLSPAVTILGDGSPKSVTVNSAFFTLPALTNPSGFQGVTVDVTATLVQNGTYTRPIPSGGCQQVYGAQPLAISEKPVASVTSNATACGGSTMAFTAGAVTPGPTNYFYWLITTVAPAGTTPLTANPFLPGEVNPFVVTWGNYSVPCNPVAGSPVTQTQTVRMIAQNANGCYDTTTRTITLFPTPHDAFIDGDATACVYGGYEEHLKTYTIKRTLGPTCTFPTGTTYVWSMPTGAVSGTIRQGQGTTTITSEWNTTGGSGIGTVSCAITLPATWGGCTETKSFNVTVYPLPTPAIVGPTDVCQNGTGSPVSTSNYTSTLYTGDTYKWDVVGGTITTPGGASGSGTTASPSTLTALNGNNITVTWGTTPTTTASVTLTETSPQGCIARNSITVNVRATPNPSINGPSTMCDNAVATFSTANNAPANTYVWTITPNATITAGANTASVTVLSGTVAGGSFTISVTETVTATSCSKLVSRTVGVIATPNPTITRVTAGGAVGGACLNQTVTYGNTDPVTGTFSYLWTVNGNGTIAGANNAATVAINWTTAGTGTVTLAKWHNATQCTTSVAQNVSVVNPPAPVVTGPNNVCGNSTQTYSTPNVAGNTYSWTIANATVVGGAGTNAVTVKWNNPAPGAVLNTTVSVNETNTASGCSNSASVSVATRYQPVSQTISGNTNACVYNAVFNPSSLTYSVGSNAGALYTWTITGGVIQGGQGTNSVTVRWITAGTQTISVTESDASALCSVTSTLNVAVAAQPAPLISGDLTVCTDNTKTYSTPASAGSTYSWTVSGAATDRTIISGSTSNAVTVQWLTAGSRTLSVTESAGFCSATVNATVTVNQTPTQTAISGPAVVCNGSSQSYNVTSVAGQTYNWTVTGGTITGGAGTNAITVQWTTLGNQTVNVTVTTAGTTCSTSLTRNVTVEEQPAPSITGSTTVCSGTSASYSTPAATGHTYSWTVSAGGTITSNATGNTITVNWTGTGAQTVSVTQTNASGNCTRTVTSNVTVNQTPTQTAISGPAVVCNGSSQSYNVTSVAGQTYNWTVTGGTITGGAGTNAITVQWTTLGNQTVNVTVTTAGTTCSTSLTRNVTVEEQPAPSITGSTTVCSGTSATYSTPAATGHTYSWTVSAGGTITSSATGNTVTVNWTGTGAQTVSVTQTNASGNCARSVTSNVTVNQTPTQTAISGPAVVCNGSSQSYNVTSVAGQTYNWTVTGGTITGGAGTNAITVQWTTLGNQTVNVTVTTAGTTCSTSLTRNVTVEEQPAPSITGSTTVCSGTSATYSTPAATGHTYSWTVSAGGTITSNATGNTITVNWTGTGAQTVSVTQTNASGNCARTVTSNVTVNQTPTQTAISGPAVVCNGSSQSYNVTSVAGQTYNWTVTGGTITGGAGTNAITVQWTTLGNQTVNVTVTTTGTTCSTSLTRNVTVEDQPAPAITGASPVCTGTTATYSTPAVAGHTYQWTLSSGGSAASGSTGNSYSVAWATAGTHTVTVTQRNASANCQATATLSVVVNQTPTQTAISGPAVVCNGSSQSYNVTSVAGQTYNWTVTGGTITGGAGTNAITVQWTTLGNQTVNVTVTTAGTTCSTSLTRNVTVEEQPAPSITGSTTVCSGTSATYSTPAATGHTYSWTVSAGGTITSNATGNTVTVNWTGTGAQTVSVTQTNASGNCARSTTANVTVNQTPTQTAITGPAVVCNGSQQNYNVVSVAGQTYTWTVTGGNIITGAGTNAINVQWTTIGNQTVAVTIGTAGTTCTTSLTRNVSVEDQPAPSITGPSPVCTGTTQSYATAAVAGHSYQWSHTGGGTAASGSTSNSYSVNWTTAGTYTVSVTQRNASLNCVATANMTVVVNQTPTQTAITGPAVVCNGSTQSYNVTSVAGQTYNWTVTGGTVTAGAGTNAIGVQWTTLGNQTVAVTIATAGTNCSTSLTRNVTVEEQPAPSISGPTTVCSSNSATYATNAVAGHSYQWSVSGGATVTSGTTANTMTLTWHTAGTFTVSVTQRNASANCVATATLSVLVNQTPTATAITRVTPAGNLNQACQGQQITYSTPANAASSFLWTVNGGTIVGSATANQVVVNWQTVGNGSITVTETTVGTTCSTTRSANVAVGYQPTPSIAGSRVVCIDKTQTYSTLLVAGSTYNWLITPANAFQTIAGYPASNEITVRWIQPGLHTMTITETALGGFCVGVQTINVRVNPIPTPALTSSSGFGTPSTRRPGVVCNSSIHTYALVAPTPDNVFQWAVTGGQIQSGQNTSSITVQWGATGTGTISCTETVPGSDCITTVTSQIDIRRTPAPVITGEISPCGNSAFDYTTPLVTGNTYTWSVVGGSGVQTAPNTFRVTWTAAPVWPNTTAASVTVREDVADVAPAGSCFATTTLNVTIRPVPPVPVITGPTVVCATNLNTTPATVNTATYTSSVPTPSAGSGSLTPTWTVTGGTLISGQSTLTANVQWTNNGSNPVSGTISCLHTSSFGCTATGSLTVTINPLPTPSIAGPTSVCQNSRQNYSVSGVPGNTYVWSLTGGNIIRSGQGTPNVTVEWTLPGAATLQVSETNGFACTVLNQRTVTVNALPQANLSVSGPTTFCQGGDVTISAPLGFSNYVWNTGETARSIVVRTTGSYWCVVTDANGCSNRSDTVRVNVFPSALPIVTISGPLTFCEGGSVTLTAPAGFNGYLWSNGATTQSVTVTQTGTYTVTVSDGNGCTGTSTEVDVTVYAKPTPKLTVTGAPFCSGDSAKISAPAGYSSYTWVSQKGISYGTGRNIVATASDVIYCQVVDINGCTGVSDTVDLVFTRVQTPVVTVNGPTTFCEGGAVTLTAPAGYSSYIWSNGAVGRTITVDRAGEYFVTVATQTCPAVSAKTDVVVNNLPAVPTIQRMGDVLTANTTVATAYQWIRNGVDMPNAASKQLTVNLPGSYRVRIVDANGCESTSEPFDVILTDVNDDVVAGYQAPIRISPNPSNGRFTIETIISEAGPVRIELVNVLGELVMTLNETSVAGNFRASVDMGTLSAGSYNVVVTAGNQRWVARMVRQ